MSGPIPISQTVDIGAGRGRLSPEAAASLARIDAQLGRPADVNDAWRSPAQADANYAAWLRYQNGGPWAPYALPASKSIHCRGYAVDSDDWYNAQRAAVWRRNGWRQTALYPGDPKRNEPWHGEYDRRYDEFYGQPAGGGARPLPIPKPKEHPAMRLIKLTKNGATTYALIGTRFFQSTVDVAQANAWAESWGDAKAVSQTAWDEAFNAARL